MTKQQNKASADAVILAGKRRYSQVIRAAPASP